MLSFDFLATFRPLSGVLNKACISSPSTGLIFSATLVIVFPEVDFRVTLFSVAGLWNDFPTSSSLQSPTITVVKSTLEFFATLCSAAGVLNKACISSPSIRSMLFSAKLTLISLLGILREVSISSFWLWSSCSKNEFSTFDFLAGFLLVVGVLKIVCAASPINSCKSFTFLVAFAAADFLVTILSVPGVLDKVCTGSMLDSTHTAALDFPVTFFSVACILNKACVGSPSICWMFLSVNVLRDSCSSISLQSSATEVLRFDCLSADGVLNKVCVTSSSNSWVLSSTSLILFAAVDFLVTLLLVDSIFSMSYWTTVRSVLPIDFLFSFLSVTGVLKRVFIASPSSSGASLLTSFTETDFLVTLFSVAGVLNKVCTVSLSCSWLFSSTCTTAITAAAVADFRVTCFSVTGVLNKVCIDSPTSSSVWSSTPTIEVSTFDFLVTFWVATGVLNKVCITSPSICVTLISTSVIAFATNDFPSSPMPSISIKSSPGSFSVGLFISFRMLPSVVFLTFSSWVAGVLKSVCSTSPTSSISSFPSVTANWDIDFLKTSFSITGVLNKFWIVSPFAFLMSPCAPCRFSAGVDLLIGLSSEAGVAKGVGKLSFATFLLPFSATFVKIDFCINFCSVAGVLNKIWISSPSLTISLSSWISASSFVSADFSVILFSEARVSPSKSAPPPFSSVTTFISFDFLLSLFSDPGRSCVVFIGHSPSFPKSSLLSSTCESSVLGVCNTDFWDSSCNMSKHCLFLNKVSGTSHVMLASRSKEKIRCKGINKRNMDMDAPEQFL